MTTTDCKPLRDYPDQAVKNCGPSYVFATDGNQQNAALSGERDAPERSSSAPSSSD